MNYNEYNKIINPETGRKVSIYTKKGRSIIQNYLQIAGSEFTASSNGPKIAIISADYDGCFDILFDHIEIYFHSGETGSAENARDVNDLLVNSRAILNEKIEDIESKHSSIILTVGSARQSIYADQQTKYTNQKNLNYKTEDTGLCHRDYEKLVSVKNWTLNNFLLADIHNAHHGISSGYSWYNSNSRLKRQVHSKVELLHYQLKDAKKYITQDGQKIDFYFFDDRDDLLQDLLENISRLRIPDYINFHMIKYDWFEYAKNGNNPIAEIYPNHL